jgi:hypothetical protein
MYICIGALVAARVGKLMKLIDNWFTFTQHEYVVLSRGGRHRQHAGNL